MKNYYRIMLGRKSVHAAEAIAGGFIGADFGIAQDLSRKLPEQWREFNKEFIPIVMNKNPEKTKIGAGLACAALWTVCKGIQKGDIVFCPDGSGSYRVGEIVSDYFYTAGGVLPHRRRVNWFEKSIARTEMSEALQNSTGSIGTVSTISAHSNEIERLIAGTRSIKQDPGSDPEIEDPVAFAMEKHLEAFLVENWSQTELAREFDIYEEEGEQVGQQYQTEAGPIDILCVSKDRKRLLVIELKRGRASDAVVGQILRYIGFLKEQIAEEGQVVEGAIIALEDDQKLRWAISAVPGISFYRYQVSFKLEKAK